MPLHRLKDYYPNYRGTLADGQMDKITSYSVYAQGEDKVGSAKDLLVDDSGHFRYLVIDTGPWIFGKNVLLPIGLAQFSYDNTCVYVDGLTKTQVEHLPEYHDDMVVDEHYEERVRGVYQPIAQGRSSRQFLGHNYIPSEAQNYSRAGDLRQMPPLGNMASTTDAGDDAVAGDLRRMGPIAAPARQTVGTPATVHPGDEPHNANVYDQQTGFYGLSDEDNHGLLRSYEERLAAHRKRN
ncbi:PRC-barrel domain-containing protein [Leptolyngbya sp. CCNP1308]|uniref:PRC-barrel domain-containing protein n=1 Tax=Leptolyngbya sp. CCNP1308 TaxID=3110255 RepID=UPI002B21A390|nr:PRC-barrel domain-containing protein [Leptolyngbya sp. CCNP1308]MEA5451535.1 PRC-barrel domain-containing protein [Leptolyngbya sp. CCNP1308]